MCYGSGTVVHTHSAAVANTSQSPKLPWQKQVSVIQDVADNRINMLLFQCVTEADVLKLIRDMPNKQSWLDPVPT